MSKATSTILLLVAIQAAAAAVLRFVPFGFDKPSSWGLDFNHAILVFVVYVGAAVAGLAISAWKKHWKLFALQWLVMGLLAWPMLFRSAPKPIVPSAEQMAPGR